MCMELVKILTIIKYLEYTEILVQIKKTRTTLKKAHK